MPGRLQGASKIDLKLKAMQGQLRDLRPAYKAIGQLVVASVQQNFDTGGRPRKWKMSARVKAFGGQTLKDTGILRNSIHAKAFDDRVEIGPADLHYAAIHHFGSVTMPPRAYMLLQGEDSPRILEIMKRHIMKRR